jgi:SAM-dependent methyltransferase
MAASKGLPPSLHEEVEVRCELRLQKIMKRSFRDPLASVFVTQDSVLRGASERLSETLTRLVSSSFYRENAGSRLINTQFISKDEAETELGSDALNDNEFSIWMRHERIPLVTYSSEWCFSYLKSAAMLHIDVLLAALRENFSLADGSTANIQFLRGKPIFVDIGSIRDYREGDPWYGYKQFCEEALGPLLISRFSKIPYQKFYQGTVNGMTLRDISRVLPVRSFFSIQTLLHIHLHALSTSGSPAFTISKRYSGGSTPKVPKSRLIALLDQLKDFVKSLEATYESHWIDYESENSYSESSAEQKKKLVARFVSNGKHERILDLGCNTGAYSSVAIESGAKTVVGIDSDERAVDAAVNRLDLSSRDFTGLVCDFTDPPPATGWNLAERQSLRDRLPQFDGVLCLALIHHLVLASNIPLDQVIRFIADLAPEGIIEFVPASDPMAASLLQRKKGLFEGYTEHRFKEILSRFAEIKEIHSLSGSQRTLYFFRRHKAR